MVNEQLAHQERIAGRTVSRDSVTEIGNNPPNIQFLAMSSGESPSRQGKPHWLRHRSHEQHQALPPAFGCKSSQSANIDTEFGWNLDEIPLNSPEKGRLASSVQFPPYQGCHIHTSLNSV